MSFACTPGELSNPVARPWVVTVIVIVLLGWPRAADVAGAYADAVALTTFVAAGGAAARWRPKARRN
ncbi:hypothetical protein GCM10010218_24420 [Streptomyces mashuensis]|uniref:Uncharacterized protein n=1 Tax=Streptomyces mashuensis TaxID=33904 RepID=A0A919B1J2_9ACTN|nr:hypothetical protein GCM10010218_24420 [Streptomyces mashuensis]